MKLLGTLAVVAACLGIASASAQAAPITVGSNLSGEFLNGTATADATIANLSLGEPGTTATSPVNGAVVAWHLLDSSGSFRLRVLHPAGGTSYTAIASSATVTPTGTGIQTFPTAIPIQAGDVLGLDIANEDHLTLRIGGTGDSVADWAPPIPDGSTQPYKDRIEEGEFGFNAVVQPAPTVTGISPASASIKGGTTVTVTGTDFASVSGVSFGGVPATNVAVANEGQLTAVAPAAKKAGTVDVTVTTIAGTSVVTPTDAFTYKACTVPNLKGKKLKAAKKKLRKAGCKLGKVTKKKGVTGKTGHVVKQAPKAGKVLAPGSKVKVKLG
jgi:large repetitive protein